MSPKLIKKHERKLIDLSTLDQITPPHWRDRINLLFNKDIPKTPNTADELLIYGMAKKSESELQQFFIREFESMASEFKFKDKSLELEIYQNDNGDSSGGNLTQIQRMVLYKRKKAEGSKAGIPDLCLIGSSAKISYCEVKKIAAPSGIHLSEDQFKWFLKLNKMGFKSYITNNPVFFKKVILQEFKDKINKNK
jgi:hypothetical protein